MSDIGIGAPEAHAFGPSPGRPPAASHPNIQLTYEYSCNLLIPRALPASPPRPESHSP